MWSEAMIDEQKLLDWLTVETRDAPIRERLIYRRLLSKIENGEFEQGNTFRQPSWIEDDDQW
jgi:hypothetical protein